MNRVWREFTSSEDYISALKEIEKVGGSLGRTDADLSAREPVKFELIVSGQKEAEFEADVVYLNPREKFQQVGVELRGAWQQEVTSALEAAEKGGEDRWGTDSDSLYHSIAKLSVQEKIQLALKGGASERRILLKDNHYMVHPYVLKNPRLTGDEVAQIARMNSITAEMILTISSNTEWMNKDAVRLAIVRSPKTPVHIVQKHIHRIRDQDLILMGKSEAVREPILKLVRKILGTRGKTIR